MLVATQVLAGTTGPSARVAAVRQLNAAPSTASIQAVSASRDTWRGESLATWSQRFWTWLDSVPYDVSAQVDATGINCAISQQGSVWFLGAPLGANTVKTCTVPAGKAILAPLITFLNDYPCPPDPSFVLPASQSLESFLQVGVAPLIDEVNSATATLDGKALNIRRISSGIFGFTAAISQVANDPCVTGSPQVGVVDGLFVTIDPLPPGRHVLHLNSFSPSFNKTSDITHVIIVK
jgi:hypothetical protein